MQRIETISHQDVQKFLKHYLDISIKYLKDNGNELTKQQNHKYKEIIAAIKGLPNTKINYGNHLEHKEDYDHMFSLIRAFLESPELNRQPTYVAKLGQIAMMTFDKLLPGFITEFDKQAESIVHTNKPGLFTKKKNSSEKSTTSIPISLVVLSADEDDRAKGLSKVYLSELTAINSNRTDNKKSEIKNDALKFRNKGVEVVGRYNCPVGISDASYEQRALYQGPEKARERDNDKNILNVCVIDFSSKKSIKQAMKAIGENTFDQASSVCLLLACPQDKDPIFESTKVNLQKHGFTCLVVDPTNVVEIDLVFRQCVILAAAKQRPDLIKPMELQILLAKAKEYVIKRHEGNNPHINAQRTRTALTKFGFTNLSKDVSTLISRQLSPEDVARLKLATVTKVEDEKDKDQNKNGIKKLSKK